MNENDNGTAVAVREVKTAVSLSDVFGTVASFEAAQRIGKMLSSSSMVPDTYKGEGNIGNCVIALEISNRIGANVIAVMQNLYIVHGRPAWSSQFLISCINASGKFTPLRYEIVGEPGKDSYGCRAWAVDRAGEKLVAPLVTIEMARLEGWYSKNGSKWKTMPELMLHYRAATYFARLYAPELTMGIMTAEEVEDVKELVPTAPKPADVIDAPPPPGKSKLAGKLAKDKPADVAAPAPVQTPEAQDLISRLLPYADGFPKLFAKACGEIGVGAGDWQTAPAEALKRLLSKCDEMSAQV